MKYKIPGLIYRRKEYRTMIEKALKMEKGTLEEIIQNEVRTQKQM